MRRVKTLLSIAGVLFLAAVVLTVGLFIKGPTNINQKAASGTKLSVSPSIQNAQVGSDISFAVLMDTGSNNVTGIDLLLKYDPAAIQISSLKRGVGVGDLNNTITNNFNNTDGIITYAIFTLDKSLAINGSAIEVLQIKAKTTANAAAGSYLLTFDSTSAVSATGENQNALVSTVPGTIAIIDSSVPTPTPAPTAGEPNSCGGTCGSNTNCTSNLYCYQGYCRNPSCPLSGNCSCSSTTTPTPIPTRTPTVKPNSTIVPKVTTAPTSPPIVVNYTPQPSNVDNNNFWENAVNSGQSNTQPTPTLEPANLGKSSTPSFLPWIIGSLVIAGITLIFIVAGILKEINRGKTKPPVIKV